MSSRGRGEAAAQPEMGHVGLGLTQSVGPRLDSQFCHLTTPCLSFPIYRVGVKHSFRKGGHV